MYVNKGIQKSKKTGKRLRKRSFIYKEIVKEVKAVPLQAWKDPEGS